MPPELEIRPFPGAGGAAALLPTPTTDTADFQEGLRAGRLRLQRCASCAHVRHPVAPACPWCGSSAYAWTDCAGDATLHSWVRYRRPFHPAFAALVPYVVVLAQLDAGPRAFGRLLGEAVPEPEMPLRMVVERWSDGGCAPAFEPGEPGK